MKFTNCLVELKYAIFWYFFYSDTTDTSIPSTTKPGYVEYRELPDYNVQFIQQDKLEPNTKRRHDRQVSASPMGRTLKIFFPSFLWVFGRAEEQICFFGLRNWNFQS